MTANTCRCGATLDPLTLSVLGRELVLHKTSCADCIERQRAEERAAEQERAKRERQDVIDAKLRRIPRRFRDANCDHQASRSWLESYLAGERRSLLLMGPVGTGKTHQLWGLYRALVERRPNLYVEVWSVPTLLDLLRPGGDEDVLDWILTASVIMLDDLGAEHPSSWTIERLFRIIDHSWERGIPIIATTNTPRQHLAAAIGERSASRLLDPEMTDVVVLRGVDRRHEKDRQAS